MKIYTGYTEGVDFKGSFKFDDLLELQKKAFDAIKTDGELGIFSGMNAELTDSGLTITEGIFLWGGVPATFKGVSNYPVSDAKYLVIYKKGVDPRSLPISVGESVYDAYQEYNAILSTTVPSLGYEDVNGEVVGVMPYLFRSLDYEVSFHLDNTVTASDGEAIEYLGAKALVRVVGDNHYIVTNGCVIGGQSEALALGGIVKDGVVYFGKLTSLQGMNIQYAVAAERKAIPTEGALGVIFGYIAKAIQDLAAVAYSGDYNDLKVKLQNINGLLVDYTEQLQNIPTYELPSQSDNINNILAAIYSCLKQIKDSRVGFTGDFYDLKNAPSKLSQFEDDLPETVVAFPSEIRIIGADLDAPEGWHKCDGSDGTLNLQDAIFRGWTEPSEGSPGIIPGTFETIDEGTGNTIKICRVQFIQKVAENQSTIEIITEDDKGWGTIGKTPAGGATILQYPIVNGKTLTIYAKPAPYAEFVRWEKKSGVQPVALASYEDGLEDGDTTEDGWEIVGNANPLIIVAEENVTYRAVFDANMEIDIQSNNPNISKFLWEGSLVNSVSTKVEWGNPFSILAQCPAEISIDYFDKVLVNGTQAATEIVTQDGNTYLKLSFEKVEEDLSIMFLFYKRKAVRLSTYGAVGVYAEVSSPTKEYLVGYDAEGNPTTQETYPGDSGIEPVSYQSDQAMVNGEYSASNPVYSASKVIWLRNGDTIAFAINKVEYAFKQAYLNTAPWGSVFDISISESTQAMTRVDYDSYPTAKVTANVAPDGFGTVTIGDVTGATASTVDALMDGRTITVVATPTSLKKFVKWIGYEDGAVTDSTKSIVLTKDIAFVDLNITANFDWNVATVTIEPSSMEGVNGTTVAGDSENGGRVLVGRPASVTVDVAQHYQYLSGNPAISIKSGATDLVRSGNVYSFTPTASQVVLQLNKPTKIPYTVTGSVDVSGHGSVTPASQETTAGSIISFTYKSPTDGSFKLTRWKASGSVTIQNDKANPVSVLVNGNGSVTAITEEVVVGLTIATSPDVPATFTNNGSSIQKGTTNIRKGSSISLQQTPPNGYTFSQWSGVGSPTSSVVLSFTLSSDTTVTASYTPVGVTVNLTCDGGSIAHTSGGSYIYDTNHTFTASPDSAHNQNSFNGWTLSGVTIVSGSVSTNPITVKLNPTKGSNGYVSSLQTSYPINKYNISVNVSPSGAGTASASPSVVNHGGSTRLSASPASGKKFSYWKIGNSNVQSNPYDLTGITSDVSATAVFVSAGVKVTFTFDGGTLKYSKNGGSSVSVVSGQSVTFDATDTVNLYYDCDASAHTVTWVEESL